MQQTIHACVGEHNNLKGIDMKKAFKTYSQCPVEQTPAGVPSDWVWFYVDIQDDQEAAFVQAGFNVLPVNDYLQYRADRQLAFDAWANAYDQDRIGQELRVMDYVDEKFATLPPSKIDFRRHLKENLYLQKSVTMLPNGRPQVATYTLDGFLIAEIEFVFETNAFNFMTRRTEKLSYYKRNNTKSDQWVIADDFFDVANPYHLREMMKERSEARSMIFEEVKAFLNGILAQFYLPQGWTYGQILEVAGDFWVTYSSDIDAWINVGSPRFATNLTADTEFDFLDVVVSEGVTVRQYVLTKTSY